MGWGISRYPSAGCHCIGFDINGTILQTRKVSTRVQEYTMQCETKTKDNVFVKVIVAVQVEVVAEKAY